MALKCQPMLNMSLARPPLESHYCCSDICCDHDDVNNVIAGAEKNYAAGKEGDLSGNFGEKGFEIYLILKSLNVLYIQCFIIYSQQRLYI